VSHLSLQADVLNEVLAVAAGSYIWLSRSIRGVFMADRMCFLKESGSGKDIAVNAQLVRLVREIDETKVAIVFDNNLQGRWDRGLDCRRSAKIEVVTASNLPACWNALTRARPLFPVCLGESIWSVETWTR
jgi:hypothetical protein